MFVENRGPVRRFLLLFCILAGCGAVGLIAGCGSTDASRRHPEIPGHGLRFQWGVIENTAGGRFTSELVFRNVGEQTLPAEGWTLFFNFGRMIHPESVTPTVEIDHLNGDFYRLRPTEGFAPIGPGSRIRITFQAHGFAISASDGPVGFYLVWGDEETGAIDPIGDAEVLPFGPEQLRRTPADRHPVATPERVFALNAAVFPVDDIPLILPRPTDLRVGAGLVRIDSDVTIAHAPKLDPEAVFLADALAEFLGHPPEILRGQDGFISLAIDGMLPAEAYRLRARSSGIEIVGGSRAGVFYGIQSLRALIPAARYGQPGSPIEIPAVEIEDAPRFSYRGMHLDVARNFQPVETVKKFLDLMAFYKLNRLHIHLTDDEGWRLAIEELPELTDVGGRRGHTVSEEDHLAPSLGSGPYVDRSRGSGFYSREDFQELLRYAAQRHIRVIPEFEFPGHARAAILAMNARARRTGDETYSLTDPLDSSSYRSVQLFDDNVVNVCLPSTYRFIETVVADIVELYREAGAPLHAIHIGGDEVPEGVWEGSPACRELIRRTSGLNDTGDLFDYFLRRVDGIMNEHGLITAGWAEIALQERDGAKRPNPAFAGADFRPYVWNSVWGSGSEDMGYRLANAGYNVVLANAGEFYFDLAYQKHPEEPGLYWAGFVDTRAPFAFIPWDLYRSERPDPMGHPLPDTAFVRSERLTLAGRERILGLQGQLWSRLITSDERLEYMAFPRMIALAERAWATRPEWALIDDDERRERMISEDWNRFANALGQHELPRLDHFQGGVHYRIPPPGAVIEEGVLRANVAFPGLSIRYTVDGTEPSTTSPEYAGPIRVEGVVKLRTFNTRGRGSRTVTIKRL